MRKPPYHRNRGSPHSYSPSVEEFPHGQQQRPLPASSQHMLGHNSRINDGTPTLLISQNHADPRRRDNKAVVEVGSKNEALNENSVSHVVEAGSFHDTRDPRLRKTAQKQLSKQQENADLVEVVHHDHFYCIVNNAEGSKAERKVENVSYKSAEITSPIASSFLAVACDETRRLKSRLKQKGHSDLNAISPGIEYPLKSQSQCIASTSISQSTIQHSPCLVVSSSSSPNTSQSTSTQSSLARLRLTVTEPEPTLNQFEQRPTEKQVSTTDLESVSLSEENLSSSSDISRECASINEGRIRNEVKRPLVFCLNEFDLDLDTEPSSEEDRGISCSPLPPVTMAEDGVRRSPQWEITRNDLGKVLRLAKVDAMRINTGINGSRSTTPVKLATYASKSSPVTARNQNVIKQKRRRRRKITPSTVIDSDNEEASDSIENKNGGGMDNTDDEDGNNDEMKVDYLERESEMNAEEPGPSGLLMAQQALSSTKHAEVEQPKDTEGTV